MRNLHAIVLEHSDPVWVGKDGIEVPISSLDRRHMENILRKHALKFDTQSLWGRRINGVRLEYWRRYGRL